MTRHNRSGSIFNSLYKDYMSLVGLYAGVYFCLLYTIPDSCHILWLSSLSRKYESCVASRPVEIPSSCNDSSGLCNVVMRQSLRWRVISIGKLIKSMPSIEVPIFKENLCFTSFSRMPNLQLLDYLGISATLGFLILMIQMPPRKLLMSHPSRISRYANSDGQMMLHDFPRRAPPRTVPITAPAV